MTGIKLYNSDTKASYFMKTIKVCKGTTVKIVQFTPNLKRTTINIYIYIHIEGYISYNYYLQLISFYNISFYSKQD